MIHFGSIIDFCAVRYSISLTKGLVVGFWHIGAAKRLHQIWHMKNGKNKWKCNRFIIKSLFTECSQQEQQHSLQIQIWCRISCWVQANRINWEHGPKSIWYYIKRVNRTIATHCYSAMNFFSLIFVIVTTTKIDFYTLFSLPFPFFRHFSIGSLVNFTLMYSPHFHFSAYHWLVQWFCDHQPFYFYVHSHLMTALPIKSEHIYRVHFWIKRSNFLFEWDKKQQRFRFFCRTSFAFDWKHI